MVINIWFTKGMLPDHFFYERGVSFWYSIQYIPEIFYDKMTEHWSSNPFKILDVILCISNVRVNRDCR